MPTLSSDKVTHLLRFWSGLRARMVGSVGFEPTRDTV